MVACIIHVTSMWWSKTVVVCAAAGLKEQARNLPQAGHGLIPQ